MISTFGIHVFLCYKYVNLSFAIFISQKECHADMCTLFTIPRHTSHISTRSYGGRSTSSSNPKLSTVVCGITGSEDSCYH